MRCGKFYTSFLQIFRRAAARRNTRRSGSLSDVSTTLCDCLPFVLCGAVTAVNIPAGFLFAFVTAAYFLPRVVPVISNFIARNKGVLAFLMTRGYSAGSGQEKAFSRELYTAQCGAWAFFSRPPQIHIKKKQQGFFVLMRAAVFFYGVAVDSNT